MIIAAAWRVRRLTQKELAQLMCVSRSIVVKIEKGDPPVSLLEYVPAAWAMELEYSIVEMFARGGIDGFCAVRVSDCQNASGKGS